MTYLFSAHAFRRRRWVLWGAGLAFAGGPASLALAAEPVTLTAPDPGLAMNISLKPAIKPGDLDLRVSIVPQVATAPEVEFQDATGGAVRQVVLTADGDAWVATVESVPSIGVGCVYVTATPA